MSDNSRILWIPWLGRWKHLACHDSAPSGATVKKVGHISSDILSDRAPARYRFARQDLKAVSCGFPGILFVCFLVREEAQWEDWPARRDTGERLSSVLKCGVICSRGKGFPGVTATATLYDTLQIRLLLRKCMFSHIQSTHRSDLSSLSLLPGFPGAGLYQLVHKNAVRTPLSNLLPSKLSIKWGISASHASCSGTESSSKGGSYSWALTSFSWNKPFVQPHGSKLSLLQTGRQNCFHSPNWADKQWPEGWEHVCLVSTWGKGWGGGSSALHSKEPLSAEISH